ncbi:alpha/beta hydrolase [Sphingobium sp. AR-3-1]|uniref:Alpha/beta hydrolase n=1 Tax=Sphingobium psychrophilum TaxID=2728834 RepID=A0A7X9ZT11_9SPHN|nr:alpha/beta hydrolase [Sphingobium psychrophilum]NML09744.1 alpha/beta hydrolase [Sphingobium psychrophilum]
MIDARMNRRMLMLGALATGGALWSGVAQAAPFVSRRIAMNIRGAGADVILIPGLASGPGIWNGVLGGVPGYRYHLVHIRGFAGLAPEANASGALIQPVADEIARYIVAAGLKRPAIVGHSMGGTLAMLLGLKGLARRVMVVDMLPAGAAMVGGTASGMGFLADQLRGYLTGTLAGRRYLGQMVAQTPGAKGSDADVIANALRDLANIDLTPQLPRLAAPLEVVYAVGSDAEQAAAITSRFRTAYAPRKATLLKAIGPSGHMVMGDQPTRFNAALKEFLAV